MIKIVGVFCSIFSTSLSLSHTHTHTYTHTHTHMHTHIHTHTHTHTCTHAHTYTHTHTHMHTHNGFPTVIIVVCGIYYGRTIQRLYNRTFKGTHDNNYYYILQSQPENYPAASPGSVQPDQVRLRKFYFLQVYYLFT